MGALGGLCGPGEVSWVVLGGFSPGLVTLLEAILGAWGGPKSIKKRYFLRAVLDTVSKTLLEPLQDDF